MKQLWVDQTIAYDGSQLRSLFAYMNLGLSGDSVVAWQGPCNVTLDKMVDGEDQRAGAKICGDEMVHFIIETYNTTLQAAVAIQRLFASLVMEWLRTHSTRDELTLKLRREGDDLFVANRKLSISIATVSPTSSLIHFAVNVVNDGTPVPTLSLKEFSVDPKVFAEGVMSALTKEFEEITHATQKVFWVK